LKNRRINGIALEMIMRDVMQGMLCFTGESCRDSESGKMDIIAVEEAENTTTQTAIVIPFPGKSRSSG